MDLFTQAPPQLGNQYVDDVFLRAFLRRTLPAEVLSEIEPQLHELGELAGGELYALQLADRLNEPRLVQWDAWGNRIDEVVVTAVWRRAASLAAQHGLVAIPYEQRHGAYSRLHQFAAVYLFHPSTDLYSCPLAMSDGAARTLLSSGNAGLIERALPRLKSRDPTVAWTSGQWMTEATGGSDVGIARTTAIAQAQGDWHLYGKKWFTSAITSQMALTLARPQGNGPGGSNLALFYLETRDADGKLNGIRVERLKDKLGTRKVPTAELLLDGARAHAVAGIRDGTRSIAPMLITTRTWNSISAVSYMRRGLALASSYAAQRIAFGAPLASLPLHQVTLATLEAQTRAAFLLAFELVRLVGLEESGGANEDQRALLRLITPVAKLLTAKQCVAVLSEVVEAFGGAGYVEDTGIPMLLRDAQVLPIWEGTTNVLALDALLRSNVAAGLEAMQRRVSECLRQVDPALTSAAQQVNETLRDAAAWSKDAAPDTRSYQAGARRFVMNIGRALQLALMIEHAHWAMRDHNDRSSVAAARIFASGPWESLAAPSWPDATAVLNS